MTIRCAHSHLPSSRALSSLLAAALLLAPTLATAQQDLPRSAQDQAKVSTGATDVTSDKAQTADRSAEAKDATELSIAAGGLQAGGNAELLALTTASKFRLRRDNNQFKSALAGNYARSAPAGSSDSEVTVQNLQGLARYDLFLGNAALFSSVQLRTDRFQGLDVRVQYDPGVAYYFVNEKTQQFWVELGYDLLHDVRREQARLVLDKDKKPTGEIADRTRTLHSGRVFVGYEHALTPTPKLTAGLEFMQGLSDTEIRRLNGDASLTTKLYQALSFSFSFSARYESKPVPGKETLDTTSAASLVYTFL